MSLWLVILKMDLTQILLTFFNPPVLKKLKQVMLDSLTDI